MGFSSSLIILGLVAAVHAGLFTQDGQEYTYATTVTSSAGTMEVATHTAGENYKMKARMQVHGKRLNIALSDFSRAMYVGAHDATASPFEKATYVPVPAVNVKFSVELAADDRFKSLSMDSGMTTFQKNIIKGWAAQLQINTRQIKSGKKGFVSEEKTLHGDCDVTYTVTDDMVYKTVAHMKDCKNRVYRLIDDWRGHRCDADPKNPQKKDSTDALFSYSSSVYKLQKRSGQSRIVAMSTTGSLTSQFFETAGTSHFAYVNITSVLVGQRSSPHDISASGQTVTSLEYEFADSAYKWNVDRDLKAREPFFSSGNFFEDNQATLKTALGKGLDTIKQLLHAHGNDGPTIQKNHKHGIDSLYPILYAMDYNTLKSIADHLLNDKSDAGVAKANLFGELLGNTGTTASALVIRNLILGNKFDNDRDAGRILTSVAFHIRRPNTQLVKEFEQLLSFNAERFAKMAIPLSFAHLVRVTCMRAGNDGGAEQMDCWQTFAAKYVNDFWNKFQHANTREDKNAALAAMMNIRFGGQAKLLEPLIYGTGQFSGADAEFRSLAVWAAGWDAMFSGGVNYFMPVFANSKNPHEVRIAALSMVFYSKPCATTMARIVSVLGTETDYEVMNFAHSLFEQYANTLNPCDKEVSETARFFLKFMKQYSKYETDWGFGVSKSYVRQYDRKKYGYGGTYHYYVVGSHASTTPVTVGLGVSSTFFHSYNSQGLSVHLRIQGLAKGLIRKFKIMDPATWKTADLENILKSQMNIRARPDQPVRVSVNIMVKGAVIFQRNYDENSAEQGGKLANFVESLSGLGSTYSINHQRAVQIGAALYEQPSEIGMPMAYLSSMTVSLHLQATVKKGNHRGLIFRNVEYDINILNQGHRGMMVMNPGSKVTYGIVQSRFYHIHVPRKVGIGLNPIRKEVKLSVSRPPKNDPAMFLMHSQTYVVARGATLGGQVPELKRSCPACAQRVVVSGGPGAAKRRIVRDVVNEKLGYSAHAEYFDCEMDVSAGNTRSKILLAFMPYNKNPRTLSNSISGGLRQIVAFLAMYPRAEKCGMMARWSQSDTNPVHEIEISIRVQSEENGARMFFRGRKTLIRAIIKAKGTPSTRAYRVSLSLESTPGSIKNKIKLQINRAPVTAVGLAPYTVCMQYENQYPNFNNEFMAVNMNQKLSVSGKAMVQYGEGTECKQGEGEIRLTFKHETTAEGFQALKDKWYYKQCIAAKQSSEWSGRGGDKLPATDPCYMTMWDATNARHYTWNVKFVKLTDRMKSIIAKVRTVIQAGMLPYWDVDPDTVTGATNTGPFLNLDVVFKNGDKALDFKMQTSQGMNEFSDYPLKFDWSKRLRNLKLTGTIRKLYEYKVISPCVATKESIKTNDNVTYSYRAGNCWTLTSGHCGPKPSYAVFTKAVSGGIAAKVYIGGHVIDMTPNGGFSINGSPMRLSANQEHKHEVNGVEIFKVFKWGSTINVYSFLRVWIAYDGTFIQVMPAPSVRGQHCGLCGNFNRNKFDEWTGKDGTTAMSSATALVNEWKWKC